MSVDWFDCEDHEFVGRVYDLALPVHLGNVPLGELPGHKRYVFGVEAALSDMVERAKSIHVAEQMLQVRKFSLDTATLPISRTDWIWAALELLVVRLVSISDLALILTNTVLELGLREREATHVKVIPLVKDPAIAKTLTQLVRAAPNLRLERNRIVHWGRRRRLGTTADAATLFKVVSSAEWLNWSLPAYLADGTMFDVDLEHVRIVDEIITEISASGNPQVEQVLALFTALSPRFEATLGAKLG